VESVPVKDPLVIVLADGDSQSAINNARGHLFEQFVARVLHAYGYEAPNTDRLNVTSAGVELDVSLRHELDGANAIAECKAYSSPVRSELLSAFYGKLAARRLEEPSLRGFFVAIPRLTADAAESAKRIALADKGFHTLTAAEIWGLLSGRNLIRPIESEGRTFSDPAVIIHESGLYTAAVEIDAVNRTGVRIIVGSVGGGVNESMLQLLAEHQYAQGLEVSGLQTSVAPKAKAALSHVEPVIVPVTGSMSDFEYQPPASPKYFVGRRRVLADVSNILSGNSNLLVLNAQSGWGKSSLALKIAAHVHAVGGHAVVIDARTASPGGYVAAVVRKAALDAERAGLVDLAPTATWATVAGSLRSLQDSTWREGNGKLLIFFDQFENVFKDASLTQEFRDLALGATDSSTRLVVGFAWKTDYVGWTENHPYQLRDEIRGGASVINLDPFGAKDVEVILKRLEKAVGQKLSREIRQRLREYSQGLPWLLKKLSGHLIGELKAGSTQEQLVAEALNVQSLFAGDLASLNPAESEALRFVARYAPIVAGDVTEKYNAAIIQSLLDQRLIVQVGERLDTYWDTFKDYLNTGRVPIEDSYILRMTPGSVARLVSEVMVSAGEASVSDISQRWATSENVVWNVARELRLLGLASYVPNRVQLLPEILTSPNIEEELRRRVSQSLRRHRAFTLFMDLAEKSAEALPVAGYARRLPDVFPAVDVANSTWNTYARVFLLWFEYAGLAFTSGQGATLAPEGSKGKGSLLSVRRIGTDRVVFPNVPPGPSVALLKEIASVEGGAEIPESKQKRRALGQLVALGAVEVDHTAGRVKVADGLVVGGAIQPAVLLDLLRRVPGGGEAIAAIERDSAIRAKSLGEIFAIALDAKWAEGTKEGVGKSFRGWARHAGLETSRRRVSEAD
jgi:hypothetical protein